MALLYIKIKHTTHRYQKHYFYKKDKKGFNYRKLQFIQFPPFWPNINHTFKKDKFFWCIHQIMEEENQKGAKSDNFTVFHRTQHISKNCKDRNGKERTKKHDLNTHLYQLVQINYSIYVYLQDWTMDIF